MNRNGKTMEQPSETPEEIVGLLGNIDNRPDIRAVQERQVSEIESLIASEKRKLVSDLRMEILKKAEIMNNEGNATGIRCATTLISLAIALRNKYE